jgi:hypothetical protein
MAVADRLETVKVWLPLDYFDTPQWIYQQWVEMFLKKCANQFRKVRKEGTQGN